MSKSPFTPEELEAHSKALYDELRQIVEGSKSPDMDTERILARIGIVCQMNGISRTTAMGCALFGALYGCFTGLSEAQVVDMVRAAFVAAQNSPLAPTLIEQYTEANMKFHMETLTNGAPVSTLKH